MEGRSNCKSRIIENRDPIYRIGTVDFKIFCSLTHVLYYLFRLLAVVKTIYSTETTSGPGQITDDAKDSG